MSSTTKLYDQNGKPLTIEEVFELIPAVTFLEKVNRVEVIDQVGRSYVSWDPDNKVELSIQDRGRTLKVYISK